MDQAINAFISFSIMVMVFYVLGKWIVVATRKATGQLDRPWWLC